jgi:hypothetical protein
MSNSPSLKLYLWEDMTLASNTVRLLKMQRLRAELEVWYSIYVAAARYEQKDENHAMP